MEKDSSVLIVDDTILEKPYTDESEINTYHYDHSKGRSIKGINVVNLIHETETAFNELNTIKYGVQLDLDF